MDSIISFVSCASRTCCKSLILGMHTRMTSKHVQSGPGLLSRSEFAADSRAVSAPAFPPKARPRNASLRTQQSAMLIALPTALSTALPIALPIAPGITSATAWPITLPNALPTVLHTAWLTALLSPMPSAPACPLHPSPCPLTRSRAGLPPCLPPRLLPCPPLCQPACPSTCIPGAPVATGLCGYVK